MSGTGHGTLFLVVGPSGVGKDTLLDGARARLGPNRWFRFPRRIITRPADAGGEDHVAVTEGQFVEMLAAGAFLHHWRAHGLSYGLPAEIEADLAAGINVVVNTSRAEIDALRARVSRAVAIHVTASPEVVADRLRARGRESEEDIQRRLARIVTPSDRTGTALDLLNDSTPEAGIAALVELIAGSCDLRAAIAAFPVEFGDRPLCVLHRDNPVAASVLSGTERVTLETGRAAVVAELGHATDARLVPEDGCALSASALEKLGAAPGDVVRIERSPSPRSRAILQKKIRGEKLGHDEIDRFVDDLVSGRFSQTEIAGFLVAAAGNLDLEEVVSLTRVRARFAPRQHWDAAVVVDKHSMGGIPGNRITPIVIPIVAAHGLTIPKTSSRAITSAAGTADVMEVLARVDLTREEMKRVVDATGACIAWNGRLTHSPVDDVMNAINRPLGMASSLLDVSSIMSKKLAAGSTHVLIDMPVGPAAKTKTQAEAEALKRLFEQVGAGVGLATHVNIADGTRPVGRGVGPVLEARDVLDVLRGAADAPQDLREKSVLYAALILEWAGGVPQGAGQRQAAELIDSGAALAKLDEIRAAQGLNDAALEPGHFTHDLTAPRAGVVEAVSIRAIADIARAAGAPRVKSAGLDLLAGIGAQVRQGQPLLRIHANSQRALDAALSALEATEACFTIG